MPNVIVQGFLADPALIGQGYTPTNIVVSARYVGAVYQAGPTTLQFVVDAASDFLGADPTVTVAIGDRLSFDLLVELA